MQFLKHVPFFLMPLACLGLNNLSIFLQQVSLSLDSLSITQLAECLSTLLRLRTKIYLSIHSNLSPYKGAIYKKPSTENLKMEKKRALCVQNPEDSKMADVSSRKTNEEE